MRLALHQLNTVWENKSANLAAVEKAANFAVEHGCDALILPEMTLTGFSMDTSVTAELPGGSSEKAFAKIADSLSLAIIAGLVERRSEGCANIALYIDSVGCVVEKYAKTHLFPLAGEPDSHNPGAGTRVFYFIGTPAALAVCYDLRFPELFREVSREASLFIVIANWPASRSEHWMTLLRARAIENQVFAIGVNRTGEDPDGTLYSGGSAIFAPDGSAVQPTLAEGDFLIFNIDQGMVSEHRKRYPFLVDEN